jgi:hypothetical protein
MARVGLKLLTSHWAPQQGMSALRKHNRKALAAWQAFLGL